jgi:hypothetical protein
MNVFKVMSSINEGIILVPIFFVTETLKSWGVSPGCLVLMKNIRFLRHLFLTPVPP